jgi:hypothetical protein
MLLNFINLLGYIDHKYVSFVAIKEREKKRQKKIERTGKNIISPKCH